MAYTFSIILYLLKISKNIKKMIIFHIKFIQLNN